MSVVRWLNSAWMLKCAGEAAAFRAAMRSVERSQARLLAKMLYANRNTDFGRRYRFASLSTPREFQQRVPLHAYDDYVEPISRIAAGRRNVLSVERVRLFEPTSGSSGPEKLIPYTDGLRRQFQRGVAAWIHDLMRNRPALRGGRSYWSISPAMGPRRRTPSGIPIGFDDDAAYLGGWEQWALRRLLAAGGCLTSVTDLDTFRYGTLLCLLAAEDLTLISVWSPTFLTLLIESLDSFSERLCHDLRRGTVSSPGEPLPQEVAKRLPRCGARRAEDLVGILGSRCNLSERLQRIWPRLALISCWADAAAAAPAGGIKRLFPNVEVQPKGLLATEAFVSVPLLHCRAPALALRSHFFEFLETTGDDAGSAAPADLRLAHELDCGRRYHVVVTTAGGLYRYWLGDEIDVVGFAGECPLLRFVGRGADTSDLVGEKLAASHVQAVVAEALAERNYRPRFVMLVPVEAPTARYRLYVQMSPADGNGFAAESVRGAVEAGLRQNPHYRLAIGLGQLAPLDIRLLDPAGPTAWQLHDRRCMARGQKAGDIKPTVLAKDAGWEETFRPLELRAGAPATADRSI